MTQYSIITDLNRCVGCLACTVACKAANGVGVGSFWIKTLRVGPNPIEGASHKAADGTVQIDKSKCIGCQFCAMSCPYNVRYLNEEERVVEKCTLCEQKIAQGELPQCVAQCGSRARFFGDLEQGVDGFEAPAPPQALSCDYAEMQQTRVTLKEYVEPYTEDEIHRLPDVGNGPELMYLLRSDRKWRG